jgi:16S rRNA A1518/A1519 N6-dimethyltransferase RsmA/KsgA/DIM1 with predicted DNA glycosylase/AP lyase activity
LIQTGYNVDVVEIDPKVYEYAKEYFSLPTPNLVHLGDARKFVNEAVKVFSCKLFRKERMILYYMMYSQGSIS